MNPLQPTKVYVPVSHRISNTNGDIAACIYDGNEWRPIVNAKREELYCFTKEQMEELIKNLMVTGHLTDTSYLKDNISNQIKQLLP